MDFAKIFSNLVNDPLSWGFMLFIVSIAFIMAIRECWSIWYFRNNRCKTTERAIQRLQAQSSRNRIQESDNDLKRWFLKHIDIDGEYTSDQFTPRKNQDKYVLLSYPNILSQSVPRSPVYFAPTLLTALGILGTFLGIFLGLQDINLDSVSKSSDELLSSSSELLKGMQLAFATSLAGMSTSILFMIGLSLGANARQKYRNSLRKKLDEIAFVNTPEKMLSRLSSNNNQESIEILREIANNLSGLQSLSAEAIAIPIQQSLSQENSYLINEIRNLHVELRAIRDSQNERGQTVESLVHQLREELIDPMIERLDQSARLTGEASAAVSELRQELGGITASLSGAVATIQSFQQDTLQQLQEFAVSLQSILAQFRTDTREVLQQVGTEIQQAVSTSIEGMTAQRNAFEESANRAVTAFEAQSEMLRTAGQEASRVMRNASENLTSTLSNIDSMLQDTRQTVQDELENFRVAYQEALQQFFTEQNNLLNETLGQQREGLAGVVADLQRIFQEEVERRRQMNEEINQTMQNIRRSVEIINQLSSAIGMNSSERLGQLQELARTIGDEAHRVEHSYRQMTAQFQQMTAQFQQDLHQGLHQSNQQLNDYLAQARESYGKSFSEADRATAQICEQLNKTSEGLMSVAHYLVAATQELTNHRN
jgi:hypothetical protein